MSYADKKPFEKERILLGKTIKQIREEKGMTQEDLAFKAKIDVSYLAKIENGYVNTTVRYLILISKGLKVKVKDLINF